MNTYHGKMVDSWYWYPYRPWLRWPIRLLGVVGIVAVVAKFVMYHRWIDLAGFLGPLWFLATSYDSLELQPKTVRYFIVATLAWLTVVFMFAVTGLLVFNRTTG